MTHQIVRVYSGAFGSRDMATKYSEPQWEPEPDEAASDQEYSAWEDRNPSWGLSDELGLYIDSDFIETIYGDGRWQYLESVIGRISSENLRNAVSPLHDTLILVYQQALYGEKQTATEEMSVEYLGEFIIDGLSRT